MRHLLSHLVSLLSVVAVTNHLGNVMTGELTSVTNGTFTLSGRTMPLAVLPASEQRRLKTLAGADTRTSRERLEDRFRTARLRQIDRLVREGRLTPEAAAKHRAALEKTASSVPSSPNHSGRGSDGDQGPAG